MNIIACKAAGLLQDLQDPDPERIHLVRLHSMCATGKNFFFFFESAFPFPVAFYAQMFIAQKARMMNYIIKYL